MTSPPSTLVIFAHPALERARVSPALAAAARNLPNVELRDLYELYPDCTIDMGVEQEALLRHERVVLQFPFFWYSAPALMKEWLDLVLTHGFAYGEHGRALEGKTLACAVSTGSSEWTYRPDGHNRFTIAEFLRPFEQTAYLCRMHWQRPFVVHGSALLEDADLARAAERYGAFLSEGR